MQVHEAGEAHRVDRAAAGPGDDTRPLAARLQGRQDLGQHADLVGAAGAAAGQDECDAAHGHRRAR
jgi:hypothetical protein